jgi:hypothetical protein
MPVNASQQLRSIAFSQQRLAGHAEATNKSNIKLASVIDSSLDEYRRRCTLEAARNGHGVVCLECIGANIETKPKKSRVTGRERIDKLWHYINMMCDHAQPDPITLTVDQVNVIWQNIRAILPNLFADDFDTDGMKYMEERGWDGVIPFVLLLAYRQVGKTTVTCVFAAAVSLVVEYINQNIFATGMRISQMIVARILKYLVACPEVTSSFIIHHSVMRIRVEASPSDIRTISSFPGKGEGTRGTDGRGIQYLDEADYADPSFVINTLLPMCADKKSALLATSTIKDKDAIASKLAELKDEKGAPAVNVIRITAVCAKCASQGIALSCQHKPPVRRALRVRTGSFAL